MAIIIMSQPIIKTDNNPAITVNLKRQYKVDIFTYLGSILSSSANIDYEVRNGISKTSAVFGKLRANIWDRTGLKTT
jgi:hypothetical protein